MLQDQLHNGTQFATPFHTPDDRILPIIKAVAAFIVCVLVVASIILYGLPDQTTELFAWTIKPTMTPLLMGAGYLSGAWFFVRVVGAQRWHWITWGFPAITTFTWFMGLATLLHWDKFNHGHISFAAWLILYVVTPFLIPALWVLNRRADPGTPDPVDAVMGATIRRVWGVSGLIMLAVGVFLFLVPDTAIAIWPWKLTPLTARVVAGWFALPGVVAVLLAREPRWSAWRIMLEVQMVALALILVGVVRAWSEFNAANPMTWVFIIGLAALLAAATTLYVRMEGIRRQNSQASGQVNSVASQ